MIAHVAMLCDRENVPKRVPSPRDVKDTCKASALLELAPERAADHRAD